MLKLWPRKRLTVAQRVNDRKRAMRALGKPLLPQQPVHHHSFTQLVICEDTAYHWLLHAREDVVRLGGNPNTQTYLGAPYRRLTSLRAASRLKTYLAGRLERQRAQLAEDESKPKVWDPVHGWITS